MKIFRKHRDRTRSHLIASQEYGTTQDVYVCGAYAVHGRMLIQLVGNAADGDSIFRVELELAEAERLIADAQHCVGSINKGYGNDSCKIAPFGGFRTF